MSNRSSVDRTLPSAYAFEVTISAPQTLAGIDNQGADAVTHFILVKTGAASAVATLFDSDDNSTFAAVADASFVVPQSSADLDLSVAGVKQLAYVGPKRYSAVRITGGNPVVSTFGIRELPARGYKATQL